MLETELARVGGLSGDPSGAALTRGYVEEDLRALYHGDGCFYAQDAFEGLRLMEERFGASEGPALRTRRPCRSSQGPRRRTCRACRRTLGPRRRRLGSAPGHLGSVPEHSEAVPERLEGVPRALGSCP